MNKKIRFIFIALFPLLTPFVGRASELSRDVCSLIVEQIIWSHWEDQDKIFALSSLNHTNQVFRKLTQDFLEGDRVFSISALVDSLSHRKKLPYERFVIKEVTQDFIKEINRLPSRPSHLQELIDRGYLPYLVYDYFLRLIQMTKDETQRNLNTDSNLWRIVDQAYYKVTGRAYNVELDNQLVSGRKNAQQSIIVVPPHNKNILHQYLDVMTINLGPSELRKPFEDHPRVRHYTENNINAYNVGQLLWHLNFAYILKKFLVSGSFHTINHENQIVKLLSGPLSQDILGHYSAENLNHSNYDEQVINQIKLYLK